MHIKRSKMPKTWPIARKSKGKKFMAVPTHDASSCITLLFVVRDILKIADTRKEVKHILSNGDIKVNGKTKKDEASPVKVFDVISLEKTNMNYRLEIVNKKFKLKEINASEANVKVIKISGKTILGKDKVQMNLEDGQNIITKNKFSVGDSVVFNTKDSKIDKILELKVGAKVEIISGKHAGEKGKLVSVNALARENVYTIKLEDKEVILPFKTLLVIN
jgi:small subunit ribosomal protein S4e